MFFLRKKILFILTFSLILILIHLNSKSVYPYSFDANNPVVTITVKCGGPTGPTLAPTPGVECDKKTADVKVDYSDSQLLDSGIKTIDYSATGSDLTSNPTPAPLPLSFPTPFPTTQLTDTITSTTTDEVQAAISATGTDDNGNTTTNTFSVNFLGSWFKLKNASFHKIGDLINPIPATVIPFDGTDDTRNYFVIGTSPTDPEAGAVTAGSSINFSSGSVSSKVWQAQNYSTRLNNMNPDLFLQYVRSRKEYTSITNLSQITNNNKIYIYTGDLTIDDTNGSTISSKYPLVLIVVGNINIDNAGNKFDAPNIALIATGTGKGKINIKSNISQLTGIFIAGQDINFSYDTPDPSTTPLKVIGNIIAFSTSNPTLQRQKTDDLRKPSVFISFDPDSYISLLPLLSISKYDWKQIK